MGANRRRVVSSTTKAVVKTANPVGEAIVRYVATYAEVRADPKYRVLCFVPSDGV